MPQLFKLIWDICCLRKGPQDLPYSQRMLITCCVLFLGLQLISANLLEIKHDTLPMGALMLAFNMSVLFMLLRLRDLGSRFVQSATAVLCCAMVFLVICLPIDVMFGEAPQPPQQPTPLQLLAGLISLPLLVWKIAVDAHVLRQSLNIPFLAGLGLAVLWFLVEIALNLGSAPSAASA
jgi:hypothetical protein